VKSALDASSHGYPVKQITTRTVDGRTVYDVELEKKFALNPRLEISEDGKVLNDTSVTTAVNTMGAPGTPYAVDGAPAAMPTVRKLTIADLPAPAQEALKKEAAGREFATIEREEWNGKRGFRVTFAESGRNPEVYVAEDGTLLKPEEKPPGAARFFVGSEFKDTPASVQETIRREVRDGQIVKIEKEKPHNKSVCYRVDLKDASGAYEIRVSESGELMGTTRGTPAVSR
jgi:uncharacterized membrane protein YkoI